MASMRVTTGSPKVQRLLKYSPRRPNPFASVTCQIDIRFGRQQPDSINGQHRKKIREATQGKRGAKGCLQEVADAPMIPMDGDCWVPIGFVGLPPFQIILAPVLPPVRTLPPRGRCTPPQKARRRCIPRSRSQLRAQRDERHSLNLPGRPRMPPNNPLRRWKRGCSCSPLNRSRDTGRRPEIWAVAAIFRQGSG